MTQALISNISKVTEAVSDVDYTTSETGDLRNFGTILDEQISADNTISDKSSKDNISENKDKSDLDAVRTVLTGTAEVSALVIEETLSETGAEEVGLNLVQEENAITINETITKEEQTMNSKLLQNLENPTMAAIMQTQTLSAVSVNRTDDTLNNNQQLNNNLNQKVINNGSKMCLVVDNDDIDVQDKKVDINQKLEEILSEDIISELNIESVGADSGSESGDIMNRQTPQEQGVKAILQPELKYEEVKVKISSGNNTEAISSEKIIEQISKQLEGMKGNLSKLNMVLNPNSLGKIMLQIVNSKEGLSAQLSVASQEARTLLMNGLGELKDCMLAQGINVDSVSVKLIDNEEGEYKQDLTEQEGSRGGNKQQQSNKKRGDEKQFEQMMFEINNNGNV